MYQRQKLAENKMKGDDFVENENKMNGFNHIIFRNEWRSNAGLKMEIN